MSGIKLTRGVAGLLLMLVVMGSAQAGLIDFDGHSYGLTDSAGAWQDAENEATVMGGHLVAINSAAENQFLSDTFLDDKPDAVPFWIGLNDAAVEGTFVWSNGDPVTYTNWNGDEPNDHGGGEDYGTINWHTARAVGGDEMLGDWNDTPFEGTSGYGGNSDGPYFGIIEIAPIPEPTTVLLDIKPGSDTNPINLNSKGVLPVAILGTEDFDVKEVDIASLLFGDPLLIDNGGTAVSPLRSGMEDVSGDGLLDLTLKFSTADLVEHGALGSDTIEGLLTGLLDGTPFEGMDSIRVVPPNGANGNGLQVSTVPEPTSCTLALAALCLALSRRRI